MPSGHAPSGSGSHVHACSAFCVRRLAAALRVPHIELDAIFHQAGWNELPVEEFRRRVTEELDQHDGCVIDGNYGAVRDLVWADADTAVWFDRRILT